MAGLWFIQKVEQAPRLKLADIQTAVDTVNALVTTELSQNQFDALVSFTRSAGAEALAKSTLLRLVNGRRFAEAADEFDRWAQIKGKTVNRLVRRRSAETYLFMTPDKPKTETPDHC